MITKFKQLLKKKITHLLFALIVIACVFRYGFKTYYNYGPSMEPTLRSHKLLLVNKIWYRIVPYSRWDVVVIRDTKEKEYITKRIIGLPNETIEIKKGVLFLNGEPLLDDPITINLQKLGKAFDIEPVKLDYNCYFYIGDNRSESTFGIAKEENIIGKVMFVK